MGASGQIKKLTLMIWQLGPDILLILRTKRKLYTTIFMQ